MIYYVVDVFAEEKYKGNQLAVFRNVGDLSSEEMQKIAKETNFSETTFIETDEKMDGGYCVRIFTPNEEVPFAGHPTLGTSYIIRNEIMEELEQEVVLKLKVGDIPVSFDKSELLWMKQNEPSFAQTFTYEQLSEVLNLDVADFDDNYLIEDVSTGLPFIIVPLKGLTEVKKAKINQEKLLELTEKTRAKAILVFSKETYHKEHHLNARVFVDVFGIPEDPATGSATGCLAGYLLKHQYFQTNSLDIKVEQGYEIQRESLLHIRAEEREGNYNIHVGGNVVKVAKGEWF
ncbi:PhzF family phenazine biosynthesis protein [Metabacillus sp. B2-18]|uniref:PhzF family phenazine biosynthesis protein n=1 Tax=Metabacillus sp. B2-18 TaxID=2897333 RepID=UPI001E3E7B5B|nr:PhzF family phenazine biosynthesis protein [Metabacillus sp. B2-18]UGB32289.1 PhzF family phenazine biosynthesis protein [Metabacillus sp. B2-18]